MDKLLSIFDEVQKSLVSHNSCAKRLNILISSTTSDKEKQKLPDSIDYVKYVLDYLVDSILGIVKKEPTVDRIVKFIIDFFGSNQLDEKIFSRSMKHLLNRSLAADKNVRMRSCQLISEIISKLGPDTEISDDLWETIRSTLLPRLKDKNAAVRVWSLKALASFQSQEDSADEVTMEMHRVMCHDTASAVRATAVDVIVITNTTLSALVERVKDTAMEVRLQALERCIEHIHCRQLSAASRELIVKHTLNDREQKVKDKAIILITRWISQLDNKVSKLLQIMNLQLFEEEAEKIGWTIMEAIHYKHIKDECLIQAVIEQHPNWSGSFDSFNASEVLWVRIRCDFARSKPESQLSEEILESLLPDTVLLCELLADVRPANLNKNAQQQLTMKYLLQIVTFMNNNDISGRDKIDGVCQAMIADLTFPEHLVDSLLDAWACTRDEDKIVSECNQLATSILSKYNHDDEDMEEGNYDHLLSSMRYLQITAWAMTRAITNSAGVNNDAKDFEGSIPTIMSCLQQPLVELRNQSVKCMGLMGMMSQTLCMDNKDILMHVVSADMEDPSIRSYALQSLVDYAMVYPMMFKDDIALTNILIRIQEHDTDVQLASIAAESSIKLLFSGIINDSRLFALLLREFFFSDITFIGKHDDNDGETEADATAKLLQSLSIFFQTVFIMDSSLLTLALNSIPELISDISILLRGSFNEDAHSLGLEKAINNILSLSDRAFDASSSSAAKQKSIKMRFRSTFCSCLCREILKLGSSKTDKIMMKDYLRCLFSISPDTWMTSDLKPQVLEVLKAMNSSSLKLDKTTLNALEKFNRACIETTYDLPPAAGDSNQNDETSIVSDFYSLAPGLKEFVQISSDDENEEEEDVAVVTRKPKETKKRATKRRKASDDDEDNVDDENHNTNADNTITDFRVVETTGRARAASSRVSKTAAMSKLHVSHDSDEEEVEEKES